MERAGWSRPVINLLVNEVLQRTSCDYNSMPVNTDISYHVLQERNNFSWASISSASLPSLIARIKLWLLPLITYVKNLKCMNRKIQNMAEKYPSRQAFRAKHGMETSHLLGTRTSWENRIHSTKQIPTPYSLLQSSQNITRNSINNKGTMISRNVCMKLSKATKFERLDLNITRKSILQLQLYI